MYDAADDFLAHYGVKGMRWGKRRSASSRQTSEDHQEAQTLKKKHTSEMSNAELRKLNERMQLEQNYSQLMSKEKSTVDRGHAHVRKVISVAKTGQELYNLANSPAGKAASGAIREALK